MSDCYSPPYKEYIPSTTYTPSNLFHDAAVIRIVWETIRSTLTDALTIEIYREIRLHDILDTARRILRDSDNHMADCLLNKIDGDDREDLTGRVFLEVATPGSGVVPPLTRWCTAEGFTALLENFREGAVLYAQTSQMLSGAGRSIAEPRQQPQEDEVHGQDVTGAEMLDAQYDQDGVLMRLLRTAPLEIHSGEPSSLVAMGESGSLLTQEKHGPYLTACRS